MKEFTNDSIGLFVKQYNEISYQQKTLVIVWTKLQVIHIIC
ncbi:MAG: hypothetical protein ACI9AU_001343, partial [Bacteroidia bacterium]